MTVISAVITRYCTVHVSDSLITRRLDDGTLMPVDPEPRNWQETKIVRVPEFRGAMAYWGLSYPDLTHPEIGSTIRFMRQMAKDAKRYASPESFAEGLRDGLNQELAGMRFARPADQGIGIHFTAYENVRNYWVPELFQVNNFADTSYQTISPGGMHVTRETFHGVMNVEPAPDHRLPEYRMRVYEGLQDGMMLIFNNGDPILFNPAANAIRDMILALAGTQRLAPMDLERIRKIARTPVEQVSRIQHHLCRRDRVSVAGKTHDLMITPDGSYTSTSGDPS